MSSTEPVLDHILFAGPDLADAVALVAELTGVRAVPGGRHVGQGTANCLIGLGRGAYLEILGPDPLADEAPSWRAVAELSGPRVLTWAVRTPDIDGMLKAARSAGYDPGPAREMSREGADGDVLRWRLTPDTVADSGGLVPFAIDWGSSVHPSERSLPTLELLSLRASCPDPPATIARLSALGVELAVTDGPTALAAVLLGPHGEIELR
jgi:hypothetical protein